MKPIWKLSPLKRLLVLKGKPAVDLIISFKISKEAQIVNMPSFRLVTGIKSPVCVSQLISQPFHQSEIGGHRPLIICKHIIRYFFWGGEGHYSILTAINH